MLVSCCTACLSSVSLSSYPGKNMVVATFKFCTFNKPHKPSCFKQLGFLAGLPHSLTVYSVFFPLSLYSFSLLRMKCNSFRMISGWWYSVVSESHFTWRVSSSLSLNCYIVICFKIICVSNCCMNTITLIISYAYVREFAVQERHCISI